MPSKIDSFQCDICNTKYFTEEEANNCEQYHTVGEYLEITDMTFDNRFEYPSLIIVVNSKSSGHGAVYTLSKDGSIEDVYEEYESLGGKIDDF